MPTVEAILRASAGSRPVAGPRPDKASSTGSASVHHAAERLIRRARQRDYGNGSIPAHQAAVRPGLHGNAVHDDLAAPGQGRDKPQSPAADASAEPVVISRIACARIGGGSDRMSQSRAAGLLTMHDTVVAPTASSRASANQARAVPQP